MYRLTINTFFILVVAVFGELTNKNDSSLKSFTKNKTESNVINCCVNGKYHNETGSCVGSNGEKYPLALLCKEFYPLSLLSDPDNPENNLKPEDVANACSAEVIYENNETQTEFFVCDEFEKCCTNGKFNPKTSKCENFITATYTFTLYCRKIILDQQSNVEDTASLISDGICVEKVPEKGDHHKLEAYITCEKISYELTQTFETWLYPISIVFLIITIYIYLTELKQLRSPQDIAFMYASTCLLLYMILHMARYSTGKSSAWVIQVYNYVGRYLKTAYFSWFNVMLISRLIENRNLSYNYPFSSDLRPIWNHFYAWSMPFVFIVIYYCKPDLNWHIPILLLWLINLILLIMVITSVEYDKNFELLIWHRNRYRTWLLVRLFLGAGVLWVFGASYRIPIFTSLFALQGILIFFIMVIYRYSAKRKLGGVKFGFFTFPKEWQRVEKIDEDDVAVDVFYQSVADDNSYVFRIPLEELK